MPKFSYPFQSKAANRLALLLLGCFLISLQAYGAPSDRAHPWAGLHFRNDTLSPSSMKEDIDYVVDILQSVHPATLDGYSEEQTMIIETLYDYASKERNYFDFWLQLNRLFVSFRDAHTVLGYPGGWIDNGLLRSSFLHTPVKWLEDGLYVSDNSFSLRRGDRFLSIGGVSPEDLLRTIRESYVPWESDEWVRYQSTWIIFSSYFIEANNLLDSEGRLIAKLERVNGGYETIELPLVQVRKRDGKRLWPGTVKLEPEHDLAVYRFDRFRPSEEFFTAVSDFFQQVEEAGIRRVAIDLRYNQGGNNAAMAAFYRHLPNRTIMDRPAILRLSPLATRMRGYPEGSGMAKIADPALVETHYRYIDGPASPIFEGELYILTSAQTFSSAADMTAFYQDADLATILGEPIGGLPSWYGDKLNLRTPNIGIGFSISTKFFYRAGEEPEAAFQLDIYVPTLPADLQAGRDAQLEYLRRMKG